MEYIKFLHDTTICAWLILREFFLRWEVILPSITIGIIIFFVAYFCLRNEKRIKRTCIRCGCEINACMGFVLARDIVNHEKQPRELCGKCVSIISFDELEKLCGCGVNG